MLVTVKTRGKEPKKESKRMVKKGESRKSGQSDLFNTFKSP
jgi:hypothetical protein